MKCAPMGQKSKRSLFYFSLILLFSFFVRIIQVSLYPDLPKENEVIFYSNQTKNDLRILFLKAIDLSKKSIHLVMFGLSDPQILKKLQAKSKKLPTKIFYDVKASPSLDELGATPIREDHLMHQKILSVDQKMVFFGSANMTSTLSMHDNLVIALHSPEIAKFLEEKAPFTSGNIQTKLGEQKVEIWLLPDINDGALNSVKEAIQNAKHEIHLAMYTLTHPDLIDELLHVIARGVKVTVAADFHAAKGASAKALQKLKEGNAEIILSTGLQLFHHKFLCIDQNTLIIGSANWTKSAFTKNRDAFLILDPLTKKQRKQMGKLWREIIRESRSL